MTYRDFLEDVGIYFLPEYDGEIHRFKGQSEKSKSGWYCGHRLGDAEVLFAGDWAIGSDHKRWCNKKSYLKTDEFKKAYNDTMIKLNIEKEKLRAEAEIEAKNHLAKNKINIGVEQFEYCARKKITSIHGAEFCEDVSGIHLTIPIFDNDKLSSLQKIYANGEKRFLTGGKIQGCSFTIGTIVDKAYICEGFATACSIYEATKTPVVVAFNVGNIEPVIKNLKKKHSVLDIEICADNDKFKDKNAGLDAAKKSQIAIGVPYNYPEFDSSFDHLKPTDYNDMHCLIGLDKVRETILGKKLDAVQFTSEEFEQYKNLFNMTFPNAKKCILTGDVTYLRENKRIQVLNEIQLAKANAKISNLQVSSVEYYLSKWISEIDPELLCKIENHNVDKDYIGEMLNHVYVENIEHRYFVDLMKGWLAGVFYRLNNNKYQNKMVIFGGDQGIGKDTFIDNMLSDLSPYFANSCIYEKEIENYGTMSRNLVINVSEFDRTSRLQVSQLKNIITAHNATFRAPYARAAQEVEFRTSFISSCNIEDIFRDETGNRRFMFFKISKIDWGYQKGISDKIIAQAKWLADNNYMPKPEAIEAMNTIIKDMTPESWEILADEMWRDEFERAISYKAGVTRLRYVEVIHIEKYISDYLRIPPKMVQSFVKKNYQVRTKDARYFVGTKSRAVISHSNKLNS